MVFQSIPEIAKALDISDNTCRRYINRFPDYFRNIQIKNRIKRYAGAVDTIRDINSWYNDQGLDRDTIRAKLQEKYPPATDDTGDSTPAPATMEADTPDTRLDRLEAKTDKAMQMLSQILTILGDTPATTDTTLDIGTTEVSTPDTVNSTATTIDSPDAPNPINDIGTTDDSTPYIEEEPTAEPVLDPAPELDLFGNPQPTPEPDPDPETDKTAESADLKKTEPTPETEEAMEEPEEETDGIPDCHGKKLSTAERDAIVLKAASMITGPKCAEKRAEYLNQAGVTTARGASWIAKKVSDAVLHAKNRRDKK